MTANLIDLCLRVIYGAIELHTQLQTLLDSL